ncbi:MAG: ribonuclease E/G, partial [Myxococcota bacterium]
IDFIDMVARRNNQAVEKVLKSALKVDKARIKIGRISSNGTLELTRQRLSSALRVSVYRQCRLCNGTGHILSPESHALAVLRRIIDRASRGDLRSARARVEPEAANLLLTDKWGAVTEIERRFGARLSIVADKTMAPGQDDLAFETDPDAVVVELPDPDFGPPAIPDDWVDEEEGAEEEEDEEDDEREDEDEAVADATAGKKRKRRQRRRRGGKGEAGDQVRKGDGRPAPDAKDGNAGTDTLGLPTFELIDLAEYRGKRGGGTQSGDRAGGADGRPGRRRKRHRRSKKSAAGGGARAAPATGGALPKPESQPAPAGGGGVGRFFRKLFGRGPKT